MKIRDIVALTGVVSFLLTMAYILGFSISINMNLFTYFNLNDYIKHSIVWIIPALIMGSLIFITVSFFGPLYSTLIDFIADKINRSPLSKLIPNRVSKEGRGFVTPMMVIVVGLYIILLIMSYITNIIMFHLICILAGLCLWSFIIFCHIWHSQKPEGMKLSFGRHSISIHVVPMLFSFVCLYGFFVGTLEQGRVYKYPTAHIEMTSKEPIKSGRVLFALSQYIVFLEQKTKTVDIIPVGQVKNIITIPKNKSKEKKNVKQLEEAKKEEKETIK
jgi:hypothetical protein